MYSTIALPKGAGPQKGLVRKQDWMTEITGRWGSAKQILRGCAMSSHSSKIDYCYIPPVV